MPNLEYVTADLSAPADLQLDLTQPPADLERFDMILCHHVLQHIPDDAAAMTGIRRLLRPDGLALITVPLDERDETFEPDTDDPNEREKLVGEHDIVRWYGRADLKHRLERAALEVTLQRAPEHLDQRERERLALRDQTLYVCRPKTG